LSPDDLLVYADFSENVSCLRNNETIAEHTSTQQISLLVFVVMYKVAGDVLVSEHHFFVR
jgi:hypothetical protein